MMASGGNMSSFDEDATSVPESTLRVPDVKVKEEYVEIHVITEQETISARGRLTLKADYILWQSEGDRSPLRSKYFDLESVNVYHIKDDTSSFELHHKSWQGVVSDVDGSDWVAAIENNIMRMGMENMMWDVFSGPLLQPIKASISEELMSCRKIYRSYFENLQQRKMTCQEKKSLRSDEDGSND